MKHTLNRILAVCCGLILIGCNSGGSSSSSGGGGGDTPNNPAVNISLSSGSDTANVPTEVALTLQFNEEVTSVNSTTVRVESSGSANNVITESPQRSGNSYTFNLSGLTNAANYTVSLSYGITGVATGLAIRVNPFRFTTVDFAIPTVVMTKPTNSLTGVPLNTTVNLQFSEAVTGVSTTTLAWTSSSGNAVPFAITSEANNTYTLSLTAGTFLNPNTLYHVRVARGITGNVNPREVPPTTFNFTSANPAIPTVTLTNPTPTTNVSVTSPIILTFSQAVYNVTPSTIQFQSIGGQPQPITITQDGNSYTLVPSVALLYATQYLVIVNSGIRSVATNASVAPIQFSFTTIIPPPPTVSLTSPNPITNVSAASTIILTFNESVANVTPSTIQFQSKGGQPQPITITQNGNSYTLNRSGSLLYGTQYVVLVNSGISSVATGALIIPTQFNFTTAIQPTVSLTSPNTSTNVSITSPITLTFSEAVSGVNTTTIQFESLNGQPRTITITPSGNSYTLNRSESLLSGTSYVVLVNSGIQSVATGVPVAPIQFTFTTKTGLLTALGTVATGGSPYAISISPDGLNVYVTNSHTVAQYSRSESGILTFLGTVATGGTSNGISISSDGLNVYVTNNGVNDLSQYRRNLNGTLTALIPATVATGTGPFGISVSPDGANAYIVNNGSKTVSQYSRSESGILTALIPESVATGNAPIGIIVSPDGANVYVTNQNSNTVSQYSRSESGRLTSLGTVAADNFPRAISVSPDGSNVYVANFGSVTITQYSRSSNGILTAIATIATGGSPLGMSISPDGDNVYSANNSVNDLSQYRRNLNGTLTALTPTYVATGIGPTEISISPDGNNAYVVNSGSRTVSQYRR